MDELKLNAQDNTDATKEVVNEVKENTEKTEQSNKKTSESEESESEDEFIGITVNSNSLNDIEGDVRMALIVRNDLGMLKGKSAAQCSHAAVALYKQMNNDPNSESYNPTMLNRWEHGGQAKIVLKCNSLEEIEELIMKAASLNINNYLVVDAGRTQIASGSATVLGLGPAPRGVLDLVTGGLKLY